MKKLLLLLAFSPLLAFGQNWCPPGATWHYGFTYGFVTGYYEVAYTGDTLINSITCKKLVRTCYWQFVPSSATYSFVEGTAYTYADADKVYIYRHNQFYTLYDFSAQPGDTWVVPGAKSYVSPCDSTGLVRVDSIGTTVINSQTLRYICVSRPDTSQHWGWNAKIVERVGPISTLSGYAYSYLFPYKYDWCGMMTDEPVEGGDFRCYSDSTAFSYSSNIAPSCDFITAIEPVTAENQIRVFPNPSNGVFTIDPGAMQVAEVHITDVLGNTVQQRFVRDEKTLRIENLPPGVYFLSLTGSDGRVLTTRIICTQ